MTGPDDGAAGLAPHPLHRADVEAMLASLVAQLLARRHHGELRFVPHDVDPEKLELLRSLSP